MIFERGEKERGERERERGRKRREWGKRPYGVEHKSKEFPKIFRRANYDLFLAFMEMTS